MRRRKLEWMFGMALVAMAVALLAGCKPAEKEREAEAPRSEGKEGGLLDRWAMNEKEKAKVISAQSTIRTIKKSAFAATMDAIPFGDDYVLPDTLQGLIDEGIMNVSPDFIIDPWGHEYIYSKEGKNGESCEVYSAGPDGIAGTPDDVHAKQSD